MHLRQHTTVNTQVSITNNKQIHKKKITVHKKKKKTDTQVQKYINRLR